MRKLSLPTRGQWKIIGQIATHSGSPKVKDWRDAAAHAPTPETDAALLESWSVLSVEAGELKNLGRWWTQRLEYDEAAWLEGEKPDLDMGCHVLYWGWTHQDDLVSSNPSLDCDRFLTLAWLGFGTNVAVVTDQDPRTLTEVAANDLATMSWDLWRESVTKKGAELRVEAESLGSR